MSKIFTLNTIRGVLLINSSVGFQSLFHGVPTKAFGITSYDIDGLCDQRQLHDFWISPKPVDQQLYKKFYSISIF